LIATPQFFFWLGRSSNCRATIFQLDGAILNCCAAISLLAGAIPLLPRCKFSVGWQDTRLLHHNFSFGWLNPLIAALQFFFGLSQYLIAAPQVFLLVGAIPQLLFDCCFLALRLFAVIVPRPASF
jgi:hypothetical protein